jgi:hypothetical protein
MAASGVGGADGANRSWSCGASCPARVARQMRHTRPAEQNIRRQFWQTLTGPSQIRRIASRNHSTVSRQLWAPEENGHDDTLPGPKSPWYDNQRLGSIPKRISNARRWNWFPACWRRRGSNSGSSPRPGRVGGSAGAWAGLAGNCIGEYGAGCAYDIPATGRCNSLSR